jgi:hypothetical protein
MLNTLKRYCDEQFSLYLLLSLCSVLFFCLSQRHTGRKWIIEFQESRRLLCVSLDSRLLKYFQLFFLDIHFLRWSCLNLWKMLALIGIFLRFYGSRPNLVSKIIHLTTRNPLKFQHTKKFRLKVIAINFYDFFIHKIFLFLCPTK